ncbi:MAG: glycosyltransferase family 4 protein [Candidatus Nanohaloarchaea archaeon]
MRILALTESRSSKVAKPLQEIENSDTVQVDTSFNIVKRYLHFILLVKDKINKRRPDILLANRDGIICFIAAIVSIYYQIPIIIRLGGDPWEAHNQKIQEHKSRRNIPQYIKYQCLKTLNKISFRQSKGYIVVSEDLKDIVIEKRNISPRQVIVVNSSIDSDSFLSRMDPNYEFRNIPVDKYDITILTVTNLEFYGKFKGICTILPSIKKFLKQYNNAIYIIAGEGMYYEKMISKINKDITDKEIRKRIFTPGHINNIATLYDKADIFLYISFLDGYPNVILEAQVAELPVITNDRYGMSEQINHGETGFLVDPIPIEIKKCLDTISNNQEIRRTLGKNAKKKVIEQNNPSQVADDLYTAINEIMEN